MDKWLKAFVDLCDADKIDYSITVSFVPTVHLPSEGVTVGAGEDIGCQLVLNYDDAPWDNHRLFARAYNPAVFAVETLRKIRSY